MNNHCSEDNDESISEQDFCAKGEEMKYLLVANYSSYSSSEGDDGHTTDCDENVSMLCNYVESDKNSDEVISSGEIEARFTSRRQITAVLDESFDSDEDIENPDEVKGSSGSLRKRRCSSDKSWSADDSWDSDEDLKDPDYKCPGSSLEDNRHDSESDDGMESDCNDVDLDKLLLSDAAGGGLSCLTKRNPPKRMCPFCERYQTKLSRHIQLVHGNNEEVCNAMKAPEKNAYKCLTSSKKEASSRQIRNRQKQKTLCINKKGAVRLVVENL
ncbi:hypothetical protein HOLleu_03276 [Holothuria leucospilota]|uniref:Uncharacterized protein n=1 Tax=Holothuria leucospilota TaxID=206669 RepID=A0A9Q1CRR2_HOLLE|nr:hypothetical protein HOLleu_03276 [Holothuria leucospilota]